MAGRVEKPKKTVPARKKAEDAVAYMKPAEPTLLGIPRELRYQIYENAIGGHEVTPERPGPNDNRFFLAAAPYNTEGETQALWNELLNLRLVCRQLNSETKELPYKLNTFQVMMGADFGEFLDRLKVSKKKLIPVISFGFKHAICLDTCWLYEKFTTPAQLADCTGLKTVISRDTMSRVQQNMVREFAEDFELKLVHEDKNLGYAYADEDDGYEDGEGGSDGEESD